MQLACFKYTVLSNTVIQKIFVVKKFSLLNNFRSRQKSMKIKHTKYFQHEIFKLHIIKMYNIPGIITRVPVHANPGELELQLFYKNLDVELLQAKGW